MPAPVAVGQEPDDLVEARDAFDRGMIAYERELYTQAENAFRAAYDAMPADHPRRALILVNLALAVEHQGGRERDALGL